MVPCGRSGGEGVAVDGSGRVPSPPLAGAWWLWCPPVADVAGGDADGGVLSAMMCLMPLAWVM